MAMMTSAWPIEPAPASGLDSQAGLVFSAFARKDVDLMNRRRIRNEAAVCR